MPKFDGIFFGHQDIEIVTKFQVALTYCSVVLEGVLNNLDSVHTEHVEKPFRIPNRSDTMNGRSGKTFDRPCQRAIESLDLTRNQVDLNSVLLACGDVRPLLVHLAVYQYLIHLFQATDGLSQRTCRQKQTVTQTAGTVDNADLIRSLETIML